MTIFCIGDSNTYGFDPRSYTGDRYPHPASWAEIIGTENSHRIINTALNGQRIPRYIPEIELYRKSLADAKPDLLIIMLGSNDLLEGFNHNEVMKNMGYFISHLAFPHERTLLISPPAFAPGVWTDDMLIEESELLTGVYRELSKKLGINFQDAGRWQIELSHDGVHFTERGHKKFAEKLMKYLEDK